MIYGTLFSPWGLTIISSSHHILTILSHIVACAILHLVEVHFNNWVRIPLCLPKLTIAPSHWELWHADWWVQAQQADWSCGRWQAERPSKPEWPQLLVEAMLLCWAHHCQHSAVFSLTGFAPCYFCDLSESLHSRVLPWPETITPSGIAAECTMFTLTSSWWGAEQY